MWLAVLSVCVYIAYNVWRRYNVPDVVYSKERHAIIRMDELRKDYDSVQDLETLADNIVKCILDALNGIAYYDDSQVVYVRCKKNYSDEPRAEIIIREI